MRRAIQVVFVAVLSLAGCPGPSAEPDTSAPDAPGGLDADVATDAPDAPTEMDAPMVAPDAADAGSDAGGTAGLRVVASIGGPTVATGTGLIVIASITSASRSCSTDGALCVIAGLTP